MARRTQLHAWLTVNIYLKILYCVFRFNEMIKNPVIKNCSKSSHLSKLKQKFKKIPHFLFSYFKGRFSLTAPDNKTR